MKHALTASGPFFTTLLLSAMTQASLRKSGRAEVPVDGEAEAGEGIGAEEFDRLLALQ